MSEQPEIPDRSEHSPPAVAVQAGLATAATMDPGTGTGEKDVG